MSDDEHDDAVDGGAPDDASTDAPVGDTATGDRSTDEVAIADTTDEVTGADAGAVAPMGRPAGAPLQVAGAALHPLLVTVPIGAFVCAVAFDVASRVAEGYVYARGAQWLLIIGLVGALVAAVVGLADSRRRVRPGSPDRSLVSRHLALNATALVLFLVSLLLRRADLDSLLSGTPVAALVVAAVALVLLVVSSVTGGRLAGRLGSGPT
jgi:uncharacterized membrane protein